MSSPNKPVFYTENPSRWKTFLWIIKIMTVIIVIAAISILLTLLHSNHFQKPSLQKHPKTIEKLVISKKTNDLQRKDVESFLSLKKKYEQKKRHDFYCKSHLVYNPLKKLLPVRAGFMVNWDVQSRYSMHKHISSMNMILPEWFFIQDNSDEIATTIDTIALNIMRRNNVAIVPMLSNFYNNKWNSDNVHRIISSKARRSNLISSIITQLDKYKFSGINVDIEDLRKENTDENIIAFQKELYERLHNKGYIVSQDVAPFNADYNLEELNKYNDLIFLMAYDLHNAPSKAGAVAPHKWVEQALLETLGKIPPQKVVLCLAAYGYDWPQNQKGEDVTYQTAIATALESEGKIKFDSLTYNLNYTYWDEFDKQHDVYFTDAITNFNAMRLAANYQTAGVALWRLGSEDPRVWRFYKTNLNDFYLSKLPLQFKQFEHIASSYGVDYLGTGEILYVKAKPETGNAELTYNAASQFFTDERYKKLPTDYVVDRKGRKVKKVVLSFDDGPDKRYTPHILAILKRYDVPAVFFVTGINAQQNLPLLERIYNEGHEIGNHTFLHPNIAHISDSRFRLELRYTNSLIEAMTGHSTILFRPPYDIDATPADAEQLIPINVAQSEGFLTIGNAIDPWDWKKGTPADSIYQRAVEQKDLGNIILLHDSGGEREETIKALPRIIEYYKNHGYQFVSLSNLMDKNRDYVMPVEKGIINDYLHSTDATVYKAGYYFGQFLSVLFMLALILSVFKIVMMAILSIYQKIKDNKEHTKAKHNVQPLPKPLVSIIVPGYNEELTAVKTVENLLKTDYPHFEIVFIDDGSKDKTYEIVHDTFKQNANVKVLTKVNGGKASALNYGISHANGDILVCIDADTVLKSDAISKLIEKFNNQKVAAVAGNVKVGNRNKLLTRWQSIEYITSQNFERRAFDILNGIMVIPGAIGAFRRSAVMEIGGFATDTLAEDCDLTLRLLKQGHIVHTCNEALAYTEVPETLTMFMKQRLRWTFGIMQSFWKHRNTLFTRKPANLGWVILPNILIFQMILPLFSPLVDIMLVTSLFMPDPQSTIILYFSYYALDVVISYMAYRFDKEKMKMMDLLNIFIQRIVYRQLLWFVLAKSFLRAIKGELAQWGVLKRTGNVSHSINS